MFICLAGAQWEIPASRIKAKRAHWIPLPPQAVAFLTRLRELRDLAWLGAEQAPSALKILHCKLLTAEWEAMRAARSAMPSWMARAVSEVDFV